MGGAGSRPAFSYSVTMYTIRNEKPAPTSKPRERNEAAMTEPVSLCSGFSLLERRKRSKNHRKII